MCNLAPYSIACVVTAAGGWNHHRQAARHLDLILPVLARLAWARHGLATFASHVSWWGYPPVLGSQCRCRASSLRPVRDARRRSVEAGETLVLPVRHANTHARRPLLTLAEGVRRCQRQSQTPPRAPAVPGRDGSEPVQPLVQDFRALRSDPIRADQGTHLQATTCAQERENARRGGRGAARPGRPPRRQRGAREQARRDATRHPERVRPRRARGPAAPRPTTPPASESEIDYLAKRQGLRPLMHLRA